MSHVFHTIDYKHPELQLTKFISASLNPPIYDPLG